MTIKGDLPGLGPLLEGLPPWSRSPSPFFYEQHLEQEEQEQQSRVSLCGPLSCPGLALEPFKQQSPEQPSRELFNGPLSTPTPDPKSLRPEQLVYQEWTEDGVWAHAEDGLQGILGGEESSLDMQQYGEEVLLYQRAQGSSTSQPCNGADAIMPQEESKCAGASRKIITAQGLEARAWSTLFFVLNRPCGSPLLLASQWPNLHFMLVARLIQTAIPRDQLSALQAGQMWHSDTRALEDAAALLSKLVTQAEGPDFHAPPEVKSSFVEWLRFLLATARVRLQREDKNFMLYRPTANSLEPLTEFQKHPKKLCRMLAVLTDLEIESLMQGMNRCYMTSTRNTPTYASKSRWWQEFLECRATAYCVALLAHKSDVTTLDASRAYETMMRRVTAKKVPVKYRNFRQCYVDDKLQNTTSGRIDLCPQDLEESQPTWVDMYNAMMLSGEGRRGASLSSNAKHELWSFFAGNCTRLTHEVAKEIEDKEPLLNGDTLRTKAAATSTSRKKAEQQKREGCMSQRKKRRVSQTNANFFKNKR